MKKTIITMFACFVLFGFTITGAFAQTWTWQYAPITNDPVDLFTVNQSTDVLYGLSGGSAVEIATDSPVTTGDTFTLPDLSDVIGIIVGYKGVVYAISPNAFGSCTPLCEVLTDQQPIIPLTTGAFTHIVAGKNGKLFILYDNGGTQYILTGNPPSTPVTADVKITPRSLNLGSNGRWVTCSISNLSGDFTVGNIDRDTVCITAINGTDLTTAVCRDPSSPSSSNGSLMIKFLRSDLISTIPADATNVEITVTGSGVTEGGESFEFTDTDTIKTKPAKNKGPK